MDTITTVETYITFGVGYGTDPERHDIHPLGMTGKGYATIEAPTRAMARSIAFAIFGQQWAFDYSTPPSLHHAPLGEVLRISWS